ncbi:hypothetical protein IscW_ISCW009100 [Ixodes scapularis]|uniref:Uncharacterized protein n=1 Tax=Ixodes scapularis TaxID=6945 RepID=B7PZW8_IXOSC|nr:hypothetical protein IscW_ISCW009100 [Ixodes scapularis]|eukprot:XP_002406314.1 hypothetical protein IscW_ISCW009100 [Ixodes scapularis]
MDETESFQSQLERNLNERIIELFEHPYYELVITSSTLTFLACLLGTGLNVRLAHAMRFERILLVQNWLLNLLHKYLDKTIYAAYETGLAIITGEEEVQQNVWKYVRSPQLALDTRSRATNNRLLVLRKLVEIQSRFPGIAVAFKSRQAGQTILNDVSVHLSDIQRDGFFSEEQHRDLHQMLKDQMMGIICAPNSLPASYKPHRRAPRHSVDRDRQRAPVHCGT